MNKITKREKADLSGMFEEGFRQIYREKISPNQLWVSDDKSICIIVVKQSKSGDDFSLNQHALHLATAALNAGTFTAVYIVGVVMREHRPEYQCQTDATIVAKSLENVEPYSGKFGSFWWLARRGDNLLPKPKNDDDIDM